MGYCPLVAQCLPLADLHHSFLTKEFPELTAPSTFCIVRYLVSQLLDVAIFVVIQLNVLNFGGF